MQLDTKLPTCRQDTFWITENSQKKKGRIGDIIFQMVYLLAVFPLALEGSPAEWEEDGESLLAWPSRMHNITEWIWEAPRKSQLLFWPGCLKPGSSAVTCPGLCFRIEANFGLYPQGYCALRARPADPSRCWIYTPVEIASLHALVWEQAEKISLYVKGIFIWHFY